MGNICLVGVHAGCQKGLRAKPLRFAVGIGANPIADGLATYSRPSHDHGALQDVAVVSSRRVAHAGPLSNPALGSIWFRPGGQPEERGGVILDLRSPRFASTGQELRSGSRRRRCSRSRWGTGDPGLREGEGDGRLQASARPHAGATSRSTRKSSRRARAATAQSRHLRPDCQKSR
jgi:hypothetical protein